MSLTVTTPIMKDNPRRSWFIAFLCLFLMSCAGIPQSPDKSVSEYLSAPQENTNLLAAYVAPDSTVYNNAELDKTEKPMETSGFKLLDTGLDAFVARAALIEQATSSIDFKSFIFKDDAMGRIILELLAKAADRGVRVRLLLDDLWSGNQDTLLLAFNAHSNIEIRLFNPLKRTAFKELQYVTRFGSITRRMHNKALISDNTAAVAGGRNIALEYFDLKPELSFADLDVLTVGPVVEQLSVSFDDFWNNALSLPVQDLVKTTLDTVALKQIRQGNQQTISEYDDQLGISEYIQAATDSQFARNILNRRIGFSWGEAYVIADSASKLSANRKRVDLHLAGEMQKLFQQAEEEVVIISPYFLPGKEGLEGFAQLVKKGVRVVVITNSLGSNNHGVVHAHYSKYRKRLLKAGIEIYEVRKKKNADNQLPEKQGLNHQHGEKVFDKDQVLHAKVFMFDRKKIFVGSLNLDPRSWVENTEIGIVMDSSEIGEKFGHWVDNDIEKTSFKLSLEDKNGRSRLHWQTQSGETFKKEPEASTWKRFKLHFLSLLPIESLL